MSEAATRPLGLAPLVGAHFRPPARQLLNCLPTGTALSLVPEPENPYDAKAIKVLLNVEDIPASSHQLIEEALDGTGFCLLDVLETTEPFHLGYIADSDGKAKPAFANRQVGQLLQQGPLTATLAFAPTGAPMVAIAALTLQPSAEPSAAE